MSNNRRSYENRSYLGLLLTDFEKVDCYMTGLLPSVDFQHGGYTPEVVLPGRFSRRNRVFFFLLVSGCARAIQNELVESKSHTRLLVRVQRSVFIVAAIVLVICNI